LVTIRQLPIAAAVGIMLLYRASAGAEPYGHDAVLGLGSTTCQEWIGGERQTVRYFGTVQWVLGVVTAYNRLVHTGGNVVEGRDVDDLMARIERLCGEDPTDTLAGATERMIIELRPTP
jgi:hypothetical protein